METLMQGLPLEIRDRIYRYVSYSRRQTLKSVTNCIPMEYVRHMLRRVLNTILYKDELAKGICLLKELKNICKSFSLDIKQTAYMKISIVENIISGSVGSRWKISYFPNNVQGGEKSIEGFMKKINALDICYTKFVYCVYPGKFSAEDDIGPLSGFLLFKNIVPPQSVAKILGDDWMFSRTKQSIIELRNSNSRHFGDYVAHSLSYGIPKSRSAGKVEILDLHEERDLLNQFENFII